LQPMSNRPTFFRDPPDIPPLFVEVDFHQCPCPEPVRAPPIVPVSPQSQFSLGRNPQSPLVKSSLPPSRPPEKQSETKKRRGRVNFSEIQRSILNTYLQTHQNTPYPNTLEIAQLREVTGLSARQIRTYFTNRRMRHLNEEIPAVRRRVRKAAIHVADPESGSGFGED
jgi:hypothetical protein